MPCKQTIGLYELILRYKTYTIRHGDQNVVMSFKVSDQGLQCTLDLELGVCINDSSQTDNCKFICS